MSLRNVSARQLSNQFHLDQSLWQFINNGSLASIDRILPKLAITLQVPVMSFRKIINGDYTSFERLMNGKINENQYNKIGLIRRRKHILPATFAQYLGVNYRDVSKIETTDKPTLLTIVKSAHLFGVSVVRLGAEFGYAGNQIKDAAESADQKSICHYLLNLRRERFLSRYDLAVLLHTTRSKVAKLESHELPTLSMMIRLSNLYRVSLIKMLHKHPKYNQIEVGSPAYQLLMISVKNHLSIKQLSNKAGKLNVSIKELINNFQRRNQMIDSDTADQIITAFGLSRNYFGKTVDATFIKKFKTFKHRNPKLSNLDFGYRLAKLRYKYHLTLQDLGDKLGISRERVRRIEQTHLLDISEKNINNIAQLFPRSDRDYLTGRDYIDTFGNHVKRVINDSVKSLISHDRFTIGRLFNNLRITGHLKDTDIANLLNSTYTYIHYDCRPAIITKIRKTNRISTYMTMKISDFFKIPLIVLLRKKSLYRHLQVNSPSFKIFKILFKHNIRQLYSLGRKIGVSGGKIKNALHYLQRDDDVLNSSVANKIMKTFNLPKDYFKPVIRRLPHLQILYRTEILLYLANIKLDIMHGTGKKALTYADQLEFRLKRPKNMSVQSVFKMTLVVLNKILNILKPQYGANNKEVRKLTKIINKLTKQKRNFETSANVKMTSQVFQFDKSHQINKL